MIIVFIEEYEKFNGFYCDDLFSNQEFDLITEAKETCSKNDNCEGFFDNYGEGIQFILCRSSKTFPCPQNSVSYIKKGRNKFGQKSTITKFPL